MRRSIFILLLIWFSLFITIAAPVHASKVRTIEGIIQNVADNSIQVRGKDYSISGIPLMDPSGKHLKKTSLTIGKKVEIFFQEDRISSILIYDDMVE